MRVAYIKSGDVVASLEALRNVGEAWDDGGPHGFLADMLTAMPDETFLLIGASAGVAEDRTYIKDESMRAIAMTIRNRRQNMRRALQVFRELLGFRPDVVICGKCGFLLWSSYLASRLLRVPFFHSRHNWHEETGSAGVLPRKLDHYIARHADAVVCHGPYLRDRLATIGVARERTFEVDSGNRLLAAQAAQVAGHEPAKQDTPPKALLYCGRIVRQKGVFDLLEAAARLFAEMPSLRLRYAGDGPDLEALRDESSRRGLAHRIDLLGEVSHAQVGRIMRESALVVTPTRSIFPEGRCMVVMESLAVGTPVVAPRVGPFPYLVSDGKNGLLFEPDSVDDLTRALKLILSDEDLYIHLRAGAEASGKKLLQPEVTFSQALGKAFALAPSLAPLLAERH